MAIAFSSVPDIADSRIGPSVGKNAFTPKHLSFLLDYAKEQELKIAGNAMGTLVCSVREEGSDDLTGYFEVWLPVEDEAYEN